MTTEPGFPLFRDARGALLPVEFEGLDFRPERVFVVTDVPAGVDRGAHVVSCEQLLVLVQGAAEVRLDEAEPVVLAGPGHSLRAPTGAFIRYRMSGPEAVLLVLAARRFEARA